MLRNNADVRVIAYMVVITGLLVVQWALPSFNPVLFFLACWMAVPVAVIAHNHNHVGIWKSRRLNRLTDYWITLFYGFPAFAWIPTHNMNHHKLNNREGDASATWRLSESNNLLTLLTYPTLSGMHQQPLVRDFIKERWAKNRKMAWFYISQGLLLVAYLAVFFALDWKKALLYIFIPQQVSLMTVLIFNYVQHVHADEQSEWNHSRNIVGPALNILLFNNGYHTVHHMNPGMHWSQLPAEHARVAHNIDPSLNEPSFWGMILKFYILAPLFPRFRSRSMRLARLEREQQAA
jgi:beta-carotene hydroxylase